MAMTEYLLNNPQSLLWLLILMRVLVVIALLLGNIYLVLLIIKTAKSLKNK